MPLVANKFCASLPALLEKQANASYLATDREWQDYD